MTESKGVIGPFSKQHYFSKLVRERVFKKTNFPSPVRPVEAVIHHGSEARQSTFDSKEYIALFEGLGDHIWVGTVDTNYVIKPYKHMLNLIKHYL